MNKHTFKAFLICLGVFSAFSVQAQTTLDLQSIATRLDEKEQALKAKELELADKEKMLRALEEELVEKEQELNSIKDQITARLNEVRSNEDENLDALARIYASTKPKAAAEIFVKMDTDKAVQLMRRIPPMSAGKIMAALGKIDAAKASEITERLAPARTVVNGQ